ncbi:HigA family addiction module antitoxin [Collinsella sp. An268]|uniref:HigA family addiction module antitoxin n=1 Tax=Collinsella sp. An268 TaxID=1965612 RepID=UPI000B397394|nr:HigA family addiction module antitoxin [Collinsella sp. An268]OUO64408.1 addiction module antidote protein, HigA family [Collinsella sp. An268]
MLVGLVEGAHVAHVDAPHELVEAHLVVVGQQDEPLEVGVGLPQYRLAKEKGIPAQRIGQIVLGRRSVTADTDLRLCRFFGLSDGYWLRAQAAYDIEAARRKLEPELKKIKPWSQVAAVL